MMPRKTPNNRGQMSLASDTTLSFSGINTYEKIIGTWSDGSSNNFSVSDANDRLIYNGTQIMNMLFNGVSDISTDKDCRVVFGLYKNGTLITRAETPHDFASASKFSTVSISSILNVSPGDYFEIWAKTDTAATVLTLKTLKIVFFGEN